MVKWCCLFYYMDSVNHSYLESKFPHLTMHPKSRKQALAVYLIMALETYYHHNTHQHSASSIFQNTRVNWLLLVRTILCMSCWLNKILPTTSFKNRARLLSNILHFKCIGEENLTWKHSNSILVMLYCEELPTGADVKVFSICKIL